MRIRSLAPLAVAVALGGALFATPAQAAQTVTVKPETFAGGAAARALDVSVLGNKLTLGDTVATILKGVSDTGATTLLAKAVGTGQLSLLGNTTATSSLTSAGTQNTPAACAGIALPEVVASILSIGIACGSSSASIAPNNLLNAVSTGQVGDIELSVNNLLAPLGLADLTNTLPIGDLANTLLSIVPQLPINVGTTVNDLLTSVLNTKTLSVLIGDSKSTVTSTLNTVTASAHASAVDIKILPLPSIGGVIKSEPILEILIAEASASATYDRLTGLPVGDPKFDPAIVRIKSSLPLLAGITGANGLAVTLGQDITLLAGTPLESTIKLGSGKIVDDGVYGKKAVADGVSIELLKGISGGIILDLAHAEAGAIDNLAKTKVLDVPSIDISRDIATPTALPRTGAETTIPLAFAGLAIAAVAIRRYRMVAVAAK